MRFLLKRSNLGLSTSVRRALVDGIGAKARQSVSAFVAMALRAIWERFEAENHKDPALKDVFSAVSPSLNRCRQSISAVFGLSTMSEISVSCRRPRRVLAGILTFYKVLGAASRPFFFTTMDCSVNPKRSKLRATRILLTTRSLEERRCTRRAHHPSISPSEVQF